MEIVIQNKEQFVDVFLTAISKISDLAVVNISNNKISCLCATETHLACYAELDIQITVANNIKLNLPDVKRLIKLLNVIDEPSIKLKLNNNNLEYSSSSTRFKYHLLDDSIINVPNININKINTFAYTCDFVLPYNSYANIHKSSALVNDCNKLYISAENSCVYGDVTDKTRTNIDNICNKIADSFNGNSFSSVPISLDVFRFIHLPKQTDMTVKYNSIYGTFLFEVADNNFNAKYLTAAMVK